MTVAKMASDLKRIICPSKFKVDVWCSRPRGHKGKCQTDIYCDGGATVLRIWWNIFRKPSERSKP